jgi:hypothetical protein
MRPDFPSTLRRQSIQSTFCHPNVRLRRRYRHTECLRLERFGRVLFHGLSAVSGPDAVTPTLSSTPTPSRTPTVSPTARLPPFSHDDGLTHKRDGPRGGYV